MISYGRGFSNQRYGYGSDTVFGRAWGAGASAPVVTGRPQGAGASASGSAAGARPPALAPLVEEDLGAQSHDD